MSTSSFIEKQKKLYRTLKPCFCPAIQATVYFNSDGLNHLLYDKHRPRNHNQKHNRVAFIDHIVEAVAKSQRAIQESFAVPPCQLWILEWVEVTNNQGCRYKIKIVLRKKGDGNIHFWSVMGKKIENNNQTKKPKP